MKKFWNWKKLSKTLNITQTEQDLERVLFLNGAIAEEMSPTF